MSACIDLSGKIYGRLTVIKRLPNNKFKSAVWLCKCECGKEAEVETGNLKSGNTMSCGCIHSEVLAAKNTTHGKSHLPEYRVWAAMRDRCYLTTCNVYHHYGGRGIKVCDRWRYSFENFIFDMGPRPSKKHSIERDDNDADYGPENCRWATKREQLRNQRSNRWFEWAGKKMIAADFALFVGLKSSAIYGHLKTKSPVQIIDLCIKKGRIKTQPEIRYAFGFIN